MGSLIRQLAGRTVQTMIRNLSRILRYLDFRWRPAMRLPDAKGWTLMENRIWLPRRGRAPSSEFSNTYRINRAACSTDGLAQRAPAA